ncbi:MAG: transglutaminase-like domain-containing protein [Candidatus Poribacteria bacterium]|nr:transglutaminase-like domain-containing protein [Candidatus Poribacteria bacterium]
MSGNSVGYISYEVKTAEDDLSMQTTVLFNIGQTELNQKVKLVADTRLNAQTRLPIEYHLSTYINGFTQSTVETKFEEGTAIQQIVAGGQNFDNEISLPESTYLVDDNFRIDHYNILLGRFDFRKRGTQSFHILTPLAIPRQPKAAELRLTWAGGEKLTVGETVYQTDWLQTDSGGMDFWYDRQSRQIVKWDIPSQNTEIIRADDSVLPRQDAIEKRLAALRQNPDLPRITVDQELGTAADLIALQMRLDLQVVASGKLALDVPNQWFEGKANRAAETVHLSGILNVKLYQRSERAPNPRQIQDSPADETFGQIEMKAKEIAAGASTSYDAAKAIVHWVTREISYSPRTVSADECLSNKSGDALSKSRLAVELMRSLGVPAKILGGLLYTNNGVFVQHHWIEVDLDGDAGWMAMDPLTSETEGVGAAHVALWRGNGSLAEKHGEMQVLDYQSAMITWQDLIPLQVGERNQYSFERDGKPIGVSASRVERILTYDGIQCYEIEGILSLNDDIFGQIDAGSSLYLTLDGKTLFYRLEMEVDGEVKSYEYTREGTRLRFGKSGKRFKMWVEEVPHFIGDFSFWGWDLIFRQQELSTELQWHVNLIDPLDAVLHSLQVVVEDAEDIVVNDQELSCFRLNVDGQLFWVSSVGRLIRYHDPERNLTVELDL